MRRGGANLCALFPRSIGGNGVGKGEWGMEKEINEETIAIMDEFLNAYCKPFGALPKAQIDAFIAKLKATLRTQGVLNN